MTPLTSAVVLLALGIAVIALFAWRMHRNTLDGSAVTPEPAPGPRSSALEGALAAGD